MFDLAGVITAFDDFRRMLQQLQYRRSKKYPKRMSHSPEPQLQLVAMRTCCRNAGQIGRKR